MTDEKIDLLLLRYLDPDHEELAEVPANLVNARLGWLIRLGYIYTADPPPKWMKHQDLYGGGYRRTPSGNEYFMKLLAQAP